MDLKELAAGVDPNTHWYYQSKKIPLFDFVRSVLRRIPRVTIVDVGSGSGFFAYALAEEFGDRIEKVYLVDIGYTEEEMSVTRGTRLEKVHFIPPQISNAVVTLMDVLEHLEDDYAMLRSIKEACSGAGNHFFITVPAFRGLWSGHDVYLGHYRRYTSRMLSDVLRRAGWSTRRTFYLYGSLFPLVWAARKLGNLRKREAESNMKPSHPVVNGLLLGITSLDMKIARANRIAGVTCVAEGAV
jgi:pimeloyl-ACP methyl ester carboxylesterase